MLTNILAILLSIIILGYCAHYLYQFVRYIFSGEYAVDKRLQDITH